MGDWRRARRAFLACLVVLSGCRRGASRTENAKSDPAAAPSVLDAAKPTPSPSGSDDDWKLAPPPAPSYPVSDAATWDSTTVKLTWVVYDQSTSAELRFMRELVVRVGSNLRRFGFGTSQAGCGLFPDQPKIANPVAVGAEVSRLRCWNGGSDDLVVERSSTSTLSVTNEMASDGLGAPPPIEAPVIGAIAIPTDAVFEDRVLYIDHGKVSDPADGGS